VAYPADAGIPEQEQGGGGTLIVADETPDLEDSQGDFDDNKRDLKDSYDRLAEQYAEKYFGELTHKPLDRELLDEFADRVRGRGFVCDLGCGPGQIARYLHERGAAVFGLDLSAGMVEAARLRSPEIEFRQGDMTALTDATDSWAGIAAFYSLIHLPRDTLVAALRELRRALQPGGLLLLSFHLGDEVLRLDELWDQTVRMDFYFFERSEMEEYLVEAGFEIDKIVERDPYPDVEYQSRRAYIFACKPAAPDAGGNARTAPSGDDQQ